MIYTWRAPSRTEGTCGSNDCTAISTTAVNNGNKLKYIFLKKLLVFYIMNNIRLMKST